MHRNDKPVENESPKSRYSSRRSSASSSTSRRNSIKEETKKRSPLNSAHNSCNSTPKKSAREKNPDFLVTGKPLLKRSDRANSLPATGHRPRHGTPLQSESSRSRDTSIEDESLELSQVSDFEDTNSKYGMTSKFRALATSTPKQSLKLQKFRSLQTQPKTKEELKSKKDLERKERSLKTNRSSGIFSKDESYFRTSSTSSFSRTVTSELDYSSVSPEYSQSSTESPRVTCCLSSIADLSEDATRMGTAEGHGGEWGSFWANYNNSLSNVPMKSYYDQCPTPYRTETIDFTDFELSTAEGQKARTPENQKNINYIIRNEGLHLTPRETQNIIKCAHILGNVLTKAIERRSKEKDEQIKVEEILNEDPEIVFKKKTMTLDLKETNIPVQVVEEKRSENAMTQTDISLPNTKSAPRIFEKILRQLSKTSLEENLDKTLSVDKKEDDIKPV